MLGYNTDECVVLPLMSLMVADSASHSVALQIQEEKEAEAEEGREQRSSRECAVSHPIFQSEKRGQGSGGSAMGPDHTSDKNCCGSRRGNGGPAVAARSSVTTASSTTRDPSRGSSKGGRSEEDLRSSLQPGDRGQDFGVSKCAVGAASKSRDHAWRSEQDLSSQKAVLEGERGCRQNRQGLGAFAQTIQAAYVREQAAYKEQRAEAIQELQQKKDKLRDLQDAVRRSALSQFGDGEDVPEAVDADAYPLPEEEATDMISDEKLMADAEVKGVAPFLHAPQPFGCHATSPVRKACREARWSCFEEAQEQCSVGRNRFIEGEWVQCYAVKGTTACGEEHWQSCWHGLLAPLFLADYDHKPVNGLQFFFSSWSPVKVLFLRELAGLGYKDPRWSLDGHLAPAKSSAHSAMISELCSSSSAFSACFDKARECGQAGHWKGDSIFHEWLLSHGCFSTSCDKQHYERNRGSHLVNASKEETVIDIMQRDMLFLRICLDCVTLLAGFFMGLKRCV